MEDAINGNTLIEYGTKCNDNIADVMALLNETVSPGVLINLESLLILDIQGESMRQCVCFVQMAKSTWERNAKEGTEKIKSDHQQADKFMSWNVDLWTYDECNVRWHIFVM